ncbi:MAG: hypothetical protein SGI73_05605 [Chloroflexota bacterium]|nr:hypothetical protein [Chloroflexota bacterium]
MLVTVNELGNNGTGGAKSDTAQFAITICGTGAAAKIPLDVTATPAVLDEGSAGE